MIVRGEARSSRVCKIQRRGWPIPARTEDVVDPTDYNVAGFSSSS